MDELMNEKYRQTEWSTNEYFPNEHRQESSKAGNKAPKTRTYLLQPTSWWSETYRQNELKPEVATTWMYTAPSNSKHQT